MVDAVALHELVMGREAHSHPCYYALQCGQRNSTGKKKAILEVVGLSLDYTKEVGSVMTVILSRRSHHGTGCQVPVHF